jgi:hypothetical protein
MCDVNDENSNENLGAFEAALASLRPNSDRLDRRWRSLLAKEAARTAEIASGQDCKTRGHRLVCIHCGSDIPSSRIVGHWAWPAAFSAMTAVAAILLTMVVSRSVPQVALRESKREIAASAPVSFERESAPEYEMTTETASPPLLAFDTEEMPYLKLRAQVLRDGVDSWKSPPLKTMAAARPAEAPLTYREQLERLLKQQDDRGA